MRVHDIGELLKNNPDLQVLQDNQVNTAARRQHVQAQRQSLEQRFMALWILIQGHELEAEVRFDDKRRWRFDFAHVPSKVAIEIEGGTWTHGRHNRASGYSRDCEKYNAATAQGWRLFRLTSDMLTDEQAMDRLYQIKESISRFAKEPSQ